MVKIRVGERLSESVLRGHRFQWNFQHLRHPWVKDELSIDPECVRVSNLDRLRNLERTSQLLAQPLSFNVTNGIDFAKPYTKLLNSNPDPKHATIVHYKKGSHKTTGVYRKRAFASVRSQSSLPASALSVSGVNTFGRNFSTMQHSITGSASSQPSSALSLSAPTQSSLPPRISSLSGLHSSSTSSASSDLSAVRSSDSAMQDDGSVSDNLLHYDESVINGRKKIRQQWNNVLDGHLTQACNDVAKMHDGNFDWVAIYQQFCDSSQVSQVDFTARQVKNRGSYLLRNKSSSMSTSNAPSAPFASAATNVAPTFSVASRLPVASTAFPLSLNNAAPLPPSSNMNIAYNNVAHFVSVPVSDTLTSSRNNNSYSHLDLDFDEADTQPYNSDQLASGSDELDVPESTQPSLTSGPTRSAFLSCCSNHSIDEINAVTLEIPLPKTPFTSAEMEVFSFLTSQGQIKKVSNLGAGIKWEEFHRQYIYRCKRMQLQDNVDVYSRSKNQLQQKYKNIQK